jgi:uracil-DNA glycosylase family 4
MGELIPPAMPTVQEEYSDLVSAVRLHLEFQATLGVKYIEAVTAPAPVAPMRAHAKPVAEKQPSAPTPERKQAAPAPVQARVAQTGLSAIRAELKDCMQCTLSQTRSNIVFGEGNEAPVLVFIGFAPADEAGKAASPFAGAAGQLLTDIIVKGMNLKREDVYVCTIVKCAPPDGREPGPAEISTCLPYLRKQVQALHPKAIVAMGDRANQVLLNTVDAVASLHGLWHAFDGVPVMPTFDPEHLLKNPQDKKLAWADIQLVMKKLGLSPRSTKTGS